MPILRHRRAARCALYLYDACGADTAIFVYEHDRKKYLALLVEGSGAAEGDQKKGRIKSIINVQYRPSSCICLEDIKEPYVKIS
jgi:hypothetical protein